jgi:ATP-dependent Lon protease
MARKESDLDISIGEMADEPEEAEKVTEARPSLPILPLRDAVLFPHAVMPLNIGRRKTLALLEEYGEKGTEIGIISQRDKDEDNPGPRDLYRVGTTARILKLIQKGENNVLIVVQGVRKFAVQRFVQKEPFLMARVRMLREDLREDLESQALVQNVKGLTGELIETIPQFPDSAQGVLQGIEEPDRLVNITMTYLPVSIEEKMRVLQATELKVSLRRCLDILQQQLEMLRLSQKIRTEVKGKLDQSQREYVLRQQLKAIQKELGEVEEETEVVDEYREKLHAADPPEEVRKAAEKEIKRLATIQPTSPEYTVARSYLDWIVDLPWNAHTDDNLDTVHAREVLDHDHHALEMVKKRILEFLAVRTLKPDLKGPILCFAGPPGVGKTSLGQSIANTLGRKFVRISLGGVRDEAEIRGHRRTYIGALPGKIIQGLKRAGTHNPIFMLDELDKLGRDWRGDPTSALLEVLDPEQNHTFQDHYLDVPFDLTKVMFIGTANMLDTVPAPLLDRMEVLELPGYTHEEKRAIARKHLVPKQIEEHGLKVEFVQVSDAILDRVIEEYTREAGVRSLERAIATLLRQVAVGVVEKRWSLEEEIVITDELLDEFLGPRKFESEVSERLDMPGVATGLAKTSAGGEILFLEASRMPGKGQIQTTGKLGDVMKESAQIAVSYIRSRAKAFGLEDELFEKTDIHVHVPAGAVPKDGPSAGVTLLTTILSLLTGVRVRKDVVMTGEMTLRGAVLPVGGIKDKVLAALRHGLHTVILPARNEKDTLEIPEEIREEINFIFVRTVDEVLRAALEEDVIRITDDEIIKNMVRKPANA